jgi:nucleotide-binding universal stress UspA family protein
MKTVIAALDASAAAHPVLEVALRIAELTGSTVEAVHVPNRSTETPASLAARSDVRFRLLDGPAEPALLEAIADPSVIAGVLGARRTPAGRRPVGRTALRVLSEVEKPAIVVPPDVVRSERPIRRLLLPLEGTDQSSQPIERCLCPLITADVELVVLHVFTDVTMPKVLDRPVRDLELLRAEFLATNCPTAHRVELRTGAVSGQIAAQSRDLEADLIVLSWSQDVSDGHAAVIREVLSTVPLAVVLLPVTIDDAGGGRSEAAAQPSRR